MQETLAELCDEHHERQDGDGASRGGALDDEGCQDPDAENPRCTVRQYSSLLGFERVDNLEGIARARLEKHQKRRELDAQVHEDYSKMATAGENPEDMPDGNQDDETAGTASAADVAKQVFPPIRHKPDSEEQRKLLQFQMRSRNSAFAKEFMALPWMQTDVFDADPEAYAMTGRCKCGDICAWGHGCLHLPYSSAASLPELRSHFLLAWRRWGGWGA